MRKKRVSPMLLFFIWFSVLAPAYTFAASAKLHIDVGLNHFYKKRYLEAFQSFKAALAIDPRNAEAHYNIARVYRIQGFIKEAIEAYEMAVSLDPKHVAALRELEEMRQILKRDVAAQLKIQGQEEALRQKMIEMGDVSSLRRGEEMVKRGDIDGAIREYENARRTDPNNPKISKILGYLYFQRNRFSDSLSAYENALKFAPNDPEIVYSIGMLHLQVRNPKKAVEYFQKAVSLAPSLVKAHYALGEAYENLGQYDDALFQYRKCLELSPGLPQAETRIREMSRLVGFTYFSRGVFYYQSGDYEKADALLTLAKKYGALDSGQAKQADEMLNAARYFIAKKRQEEKIANERREIKAQSYINKNITVDDVARNPQTYIGQSVEWSGTGIWSELDGRQPRFYANSNSAVNPDSNLDFAFGVVFPKALPQDPRVSPYSSITVKGKIIKVEKILNTSTNTVSSRRQPIVEATEVIFTRDNYEQPLVLRFY